MLRRHPDAVMPDLADPDAFEPSNVIVAINTMLFCSLSLSILGALGALVVKQWIRRYEAYGASSSPLCQRLRRRTRLRMAIEAWHLRDIIGAYLPRLTSPFPSFLSLS
jgi:hypothetical protein